VRRLLAVVTLPVVLAAGLVGVTGTRDAKAAPLAGQGCIFGIICLPGSSPSPTPSASAATPTSSPSSSSSSQPAAAKNCILGFICLPGSSPSPTPSPSAASPTSSAVPSAGASPATTGSPSPSATSAGAAQKSAAAGAGLVASAATSELTAGSANITGFHYVGNVSVPVAGGTESVMKFTADSIDLSGNVTVTVTQDGTTVTTVSASQDFSDGVTLYATKLSGSLLGVPLTFTPSTISAVLLTVANVASGVVPLTMTGVTTDQFLISGGSQVTTQLSMT